jgi:GNAT superfamily N-acetyltransferase
LAEKDTMPAPPIIRPALAHEYDEIARVWMESWVSTGFLQASPSHLANMRARLARENGWSLFVAEVDGTLAAMLALRLPDKHLNQLFVAPEHQGKGIGRQLLAFTRQQLPDEIWLRCVRDNALVRARGFRLRERAGRADDRLDAEALPLEKTTDVRPDHPPRARA